MAAKPKRWRKRASKFQQDRETKTIVKEILAGKSKRDLILWPRCSINFDIGREKTSDTPQNTSFSANVFFVRRLVLRAVKNEKM